MFGMLTRRGVFERPRRWIAAGAIVGVVFAQIVTAAHACPNFSPWSDAAAVHANAEAVSPSCHDLAHKAKDNANVCESHCLTGQQVDTQTDAPAAAIAPRLALTLRAVDPSAARTRDLSSLPALGAAAPPLLRFSRLLI
jgi:hypothetical protein